MVSSFLVHPTRTKPQTRTRNQKPETRNHEETMSEFQGRVAIVTGGSRGIGRAIVKELAARGAAVAFSYSRNQEMADQLVAEVAAAGGRARAFPAGAADRPAA